MNYDRPRDRSIEEYDILFDTNKSLGTDIVSYIAGKVGFNDFDWTDAGVGMGKAFVEAGKKFDEIKRNRLITCNLNQYGIDIDPAMKNYSVKDGQKIYEFYQGEIGDIVLPKKQDLITMAVENIDMDSFVLGLYNMVEQLKNGGYLLVHSHLDKENPRYAPFVDFIKDMAQSESYARKSTTFHSTIDDTLRGRINGKPVDMATITVSVAIQKVK